MKKIRITIVGTLIYIICNIIVGCNNDLNNKNLESYVGASSFYDNIVNDFSIQSYYLALNTKNVDGEAFVLLIQNDDLWHIFKSEKCYSWKEYVTLMKKTLSNNDTLVLDTELSKRLSRYRLNDKCVKLDLQNVRHIATTYFENGQLKHEFESDSMLKQCIIYKLYINGVLVRNNDESGLPVLK